MTENIYVNQKIPKILSDIFRSLIFRQKSPLSLSYLIKLPRKSTHSKAKQTVENRKCNESCFQKNLHIDIVSKPLSSKDNEEKGSPAKETVSERKEVSNKRPSNDGNKQIMGPPKELLPKRPRIMAPSRDKKVVVFTAPSTQKIPPKRSSSPVAKSSSPPKDVSRSTGQIKNAPEMVRNLVLDAKGTEKPTEKSKVASSLEQKQKFPVAKFNAFRESASSLLQGICAKLPVSKSNKCQTSNVQSNAVSSQLLVKTTTNVKSKSPSRDNCVSSSTRDDVSKGPVDKELVIKEKPVAPTNKEGQSIKVKSSDVVGISSKDEVSTSLTVNTNGLEEDDLAKRTSCADSGRGSDVSVCSSVDSDSSSLVSPPISAESPPMLRIVTSPQPPDEGVDMKTDNEVEQPPPAKAIKLESKSPKETEEPKKKKDAKESFQQPSAEIIDSGPLDLTTKPLHRTDCFTSSKEWKKRQNQKHKNFIYSTTNGDSAKTPLAYTHSAAASIPCPNKPLVVKITRTPLPVTNSRPPPQYIPNTPVFYSRSPRMHLGIPTVGMPTACMGYSPLPPHHHKTNNNTNNHHNHKCKSSYK